MWWLTETATVTYAKTRKMTPQTTSSTPAKVSSSSPYVQPPRAAKVEAAAAPKTTHRSRNAQGTNTLPHNTKPTVVDFSCTISSDSTDLNEEVCVDPTPIPPTPLELSPPAFPPPIIAKTKSSSSAKSRKQEPRAHVPFPSSVTEGVQEDRPPRIPQMSTARGRDGGRTQSGGVNGVIALDPGPAELDDPDGDGF
jgi:hypothetical protein